MGDKGTFWLPESGSTLSPGLDSLFYFTYWISVVIFVAVTVAVIVFAIKYRRRNDSDIPPIVHENKLLETAWIVVPTILVLIVFTWGFRSFLKLHSPPANAYEIQVTAKQWLWDYTYPNGKTSTGDLVVPVDRPVRLVMTSTDVLHSFFVPAFRVKQDVVPNRYSSVWFEATGQGEYHILCTEYCGTQHSGMLGSVIVQSAEDFDAWLQSGVEDMAPAEYGALLYTQQNCNVCHSVDGTRLVGPTLLGLFGRQTTFTDGTTAVADENYIMESIVNPMAKIVEGYPPGMPTIYSSFDSDQLNALVAFIKEQQ
ncbi:MAG: cytochrome c oxidase subunit II [Rhodothermales bacterium]|nr:cytochrome c oxidase subunit II [Rhodothermales bacterium]